MGSIPVLKPRETCRILEHLGFIVVRQRGSHVQYRHRDGRGTTVPMHKGHDIAPSTNRPRYWPDCGRIYFSSLISRSYLHLHCDTCVATKDIHHFHARHVFACFRIFIEAGIAHRFQRTILVCAITRFSNNLFGQV